MNECSVSECGEHGECVEGACICTKGWEGPNCTTSKCLKDQTVKQVEISKLKFISFW